VFLSILYDIFELGFELIKIYLGIAEKRVSGEVGRERGGG